jgi:hypothetical protein
VTEYVKCVADEHVRQWQNFIMLNAFKSGIRGMKSIAWRRIGDGFAAQTSAVSAVLT